MAQPYWVDRQKPRSKDLAHLKTLPEDSENQLHTDHIPVKLKSTCMTRKSRKRIQRNTM